MATNVKIEGIPFDEFVKKIKSFPSTGIEDELAKLAKDWFLQSFPNSNSDNGGQKTNASERGWEPRKKKYLYPALTKTGKLKKSIHTEGNTVKTDVYYASFQNDGTERIPQRQFIGDSKEMDKKMSSIITDKLTKYLNSL